MNAAGRLAAGPLEIKADLQSARGELRAEIGKMGMRVMIWNAVVVLAGAIGSALTILRATGHV